MPKLDIYGSNGYKGWNVFASLQTVYAITWDVEENKIILSFLSLFLTIALSDYLLLSTVFYSGSFLCLEKKQTALSK